MAMLGSSLHPTRYRGAMARKILWRSQSSHYSTLDWSARRSQRDETPPGNAETRGDADRRARESRTDESSRRACATCQGIPNDTLERGGTASAGGGSQCAKSEYQLDARAAAVGARPLSRARARALFRRRTSCAWGSLRLQHYGIL